MHKPLCYFFSTSGEISFSVDGFLKSNEEIPCTLASEEITWNVLVFF